MDIVFGIALLIGLAFFAYMGSVMVSEQKEKRNAKSRKEKVPVHKKGKSGSKKSKKAKK
tara:strand:- start:23711 stop:23887 length:177 start_codon:yes stop_codon:yes gene_type:complete